MVVIDIMNWYDKYKGLTYKHLGNDPATGIDCINLVKLVLKEQCDIHLWYDSSTFCEEEAENWYDYPDVGNPFGKFRDSQYGWVEVNDDPKCFDVITFYWGSTTIPNHVGIFVESDKILQIGLNKKSWVGRYGRANSQYKDGLYRWNQFIEN